MNSNMLLVWHKNMEAGRMFPKQFKWSISYPQCGCPQLGGELYKNINTRYAYKGTVVDFEAISSMRSGV